MLSAEVSTILQHARHPRDIIATGSGKVGWAFKFQTFGTSIRVNKKTLSEATTVSLLIWMARYVPVPGEGEVAEILEGTAQVAHGVCVQRVILQRRLIFRDGPGSRSRANVVTNRTRTLLFNQ